jgi:acyl-CoA thioesterase
MIISVKTPAKGRKLKGTDYFGELLGIKVIEVRSGYAKVSLTIARDHLNFAGFAHGGVIFALADCAFAEASNAGDAQAVAVQVNINYIRPCSEGDTLIAEASRVSEGKTFSLFSVTVTKEDKTVALFSGLAYKLQPDR